MADDDCLICGDCWWNACGNPADYTITDCELTYRGSHAYRGDVDLCTGHMAQAQILGRVNVDWRVLEQAIAKAS